MKSTVRPLFIVLLLLLPFTALAQDELHSRPLDKLPMVWDGSFRHFVYSGSPEQALASGADARVVINLLRQRLDLQRASLDVTGRAQVGLASAATTTTKPKKKIDWSVSLGAGTVQALQFPAIFTVSQTTPDCINDYVAYALNVPGVTGGQANIVGINNLYSGNPAGQCGTAPTIKFAYNGSTAGGRILVWPDINFLDPGVPDGSKIAYVESTTKSAILHILTWKDGEGTDATHAAAPVASGKCTSTSSCLVSVTFSKSFPSTFGGVFVDWRSDKGWAASDDGTIYEFSCTFTCPLNTNPVINWTFKLPVAGTGGALPMPSVPAYDLNNQTINVSDALGELWILNEAGTPSVLYGPMMIGGGGCSVTNPPGRTGTPKPCTANGGSFGLTEGVIEDEEVFKIYAWTGNNGVVGASANVTQTNRDLTNPIVANIGFGSAGNTTTNVDIHFPTFDHGWWINDAANAHIYFCGTGGSDTTPFLRSVGFEAAWPNMDTSSVSASFALGPSAGIPCAPLSALYNPNLNLGNNNADHDLLVAALMSSTAGDVETLDISPAGGATGIIPLNTVAYRGGTSGVTWEVINAPQASSLYFATLQTNSSCGGTHCAVKLTQEGLQ